jgi:ABC-type transport system involved in cytochrome bd biosynthesis fused ATPase/permease subunit
VGQRFVLDLRNRVYRKLQGQSLSYLHENRIGDLQARVMGDIDVLQEVAIQGTDLITSPVQWRRATSTSRLAVWS